jgi:hypothetical protein
MSWLADNLTAVDRLTPMVQAGGAPARVRGGSDRFTIDGSSDLERFLQNQCGEVLDGLNRALPKGQLQALVLGGGYGRGEGGVLRVGATDFPYNDLEFYVFLRGNKELNELRFGSRLHALEHSLSHAAGLQVELKLDSLSALRRRSVSMFSYDLVSRHRSVFGGENVFSGCEHHLNPSRIPVSEATRLLLNRCSGLLLVQDLLKRGSCSASGEGSIVRGNSDCADLIEAEAADFIGRNLAKMRLGLGDSVLAAVGQYHWSCRKRRDLLQRISPSRELPWLKQVQELHSLGVDFKLHPIRQLGSVKEFSEQHRRLSALAREIWLWVEIHRQDDAVAPGAARPGDRPSTQASAGAWANRVRHLRLYGPMGVWAPNAGCYPRERLLRSLPLLLWAGDLARQPEVVDYLQRQLLTSAADWNGLLAGYKRIWGRYG